MKKLFCLLTISSLIFCTSCSISGQKEIDIAQAGYTCTADIDFTKDFIVNATLNVTGAGIFSVHINLPKEFSGLSFILIMMK